MKMILNTIRLIANDEATDYAFGDFDSLKQNVAVAFINPEIYKKLNLKGDSNLKIKNEYGVVVLKGKEDKSVPEGMINVPVSAWANQITGVESNDLIFKNIEVDIEPTDEKVLDLKTLIDKIKTVGGA